MLLKKGSRSSMVLVMQKLLLSIGYSIDIDGIFGSDTEKVVRAFQSDYKLNPDGLFGNASYNKLIELSKKQTQNFQEKIVWVSPMQLKAAIVNKKSTDIKKIYKSFINANFFSGSKCIGWLISEGKILSERHEYKTWAGNKKGTLIIFKNGDIKIAQMYDSEISLIKNQIWFCTQGFINAREEGFNPKEIDYICYRPILLYSESTNKVGICVYKGDSSLADDVAKKYGSKKYCLLDSGGSTNFYNNSVGLFVTSRVLNNIIYW